MSLLEPERFWSEPLDRRLDAVRNIRLVGREVALSPLRPAEALAAAFATHLKDLEPETDLGSDAFAPWSRFQSDMLGIEDYEASAVARYAQRLGRLDAADVAIALGLLREAADLAEDSAQRQRHGLLRAPDFRGP